MTQQFYLFVRERGKEREKEGKRGKERERESREQIPPWNHTHLCSSRNHTHLCSSTTMVKAMASLLSFLASLYCLFIVDMVRYGCAAKHLCMLGPACPLQKAYVNGVEDPNGSWKHICEHCKGTMHGGACGQLLADALESLDEENSRRQLGGRRAVR